MTAARTHVLLMTATIAPSAGMAGVRANPELRRRDYEAALRSYLAFPRPFPDRILFCENSGADTASLRRMAEDENPHGKQVDVLSFVSDCPPDLGKGYAELDILDRAHDAFFRGRPEARDTVIWKVTGRLGVANLPEMISTAPKDFDLYADFRSVPLIGQRFGGNDWVDTRFLAYTPAGYERYLYKINDRLGGGMEQAIYEKLRPEVDGGSGIVPRFRRQPLITGICAGTGRNYDDLKYAVKNTMRRVTRRVAPSLWI